MNATGGAFDPYSAGWHDTIYESYRALRDEHPVYWNERRQFWALSRFEDVWDALADPESLCVSEVLEGKALLPMLVYMDGKRHTKHRALVSKAFTLRRIDEMESRVRRVARERLDALADDDTVDLLRHYAAEIPSRIIAEMIGVPEERRARFLEWTEQMIFAGVQPGVMQEASGKCYAEFRSLLDERRRAPASDLMSALLAAEVDGERLGEDEMLGFCFNLILAGNDTTMNLIGSGATLLARHPEQRELLVASPRRIPNAVEEMLRLESPTQMLPRMTTVPYTRHDVTIPANARVLLVFGAANHDDREFEDPERFDVTRTIRRHLAFGRGMHFCLGASLARLEARVAFEELLMRFPHYTLAGETGWQESNWARSHRQVTVRLRGAA